MRHLLPLVRRRRERGAIMIIALLVMIFLLIIAVALLQLTGSGVTSAARARNVNQSQAAANGGVQKAISWLNGADLTSTSLRDALATRDNDPSSLDQRTGTLGSSCYEWWFEPDKYKAEAGTLVIASRGVSPGTKNAATHECAADAQGVPAQTFSVEATVKVAPAALGYAIAGNDLYLGQNP